MSDIPFVIGKIDTSLLSDPNRRPKPRVRKREEKLNEPNNQNNENEARRAVKKFKEPCIMPYEYLDLDYDKSIDLYSEHPLLSIIIPKLTIKSNITLNYFIEVALSRVDCNDSLDDLRHFFNVDGDVVDDIELLGNLLSLLREYRCFGETGDMEKLQSHPLLFGSDLSNLTYQELDIDEAIFEIRISDLDIHPFCGITIKDIMKVYRTNYKNFQPYRRLYMDISDQEDFECIVKGLIRENKTTILSILTKAKKGGKRGRPTESLESFFLTTNKEYQDLYIEELKKVCIGAKGKKITLVMKAATTVGILNGYPSFSALKEVFGDIGCTAGYHNSKNRIKEDDNKYIDMKNKLIQMKKKIENE